MTRKTSGQWPSVVRAVLYYDREEIVNADAAKRRPEPYAAVITRVHKNDKGEETELVSLAVFDPEVGYQLKRDVPEGDYDAEGVPIPAAHRWFWPYTGRQTYTVTAQPVNLEPDHVARDGGGPEKAEEQPVGN